MIVLGSQIPIKHEPSPRDLMVGRIINNVTIAEEGVYITVDYGRTYYLPCSPCAVSFQHIKKSPSEPEEVRLDTLKHLIALSEEEEQYKYDSYMNGYHNGLIAAYNLMANKNLEQVIWNPSPVRFLLVKTLEYLGINVKKHNSKLSRIFKFFE